MKFYSGTFLVSNEEAQTVLEAVGSTEDALTNQFGELAAAFEKGIEDGAIKNMPQAIEAFSKLDFFFQHMVTAGMLFFFENYNRGVELLRQQDAKQNKEEGDE